MATTGLPKNERWNTGTLTGVPQVAAMLGELNAVWAFLEHSFPKVLSRVLFISDNASEAILFALNNTSAKIDILVNLVERHTPEDERAPLLAAFATIQKLAKRRNAFVHQLMGYDDRGRVCRWDFRSPKDKQSRRIIFKVDEIGDLIEEIRQAYNALLAATFPEMGPPPLPKKRRGPIGAPKKAKGPKRQQTR